METNLAVHLNHGFTMARIDLVTTVRAQSDPENQSHTIRKHHNTAI